MKNLIVFTISLLLIIGFGVYEIRYFKDSSSYVLSDVEYSRNLIINDKFDEANKHIKELEKTWDGMKDVWNIFINHDEIDDIQEALTSYKMYVRLNKKDEALVYAELLYENFIHISMKEQIKLYNVF